MMARRQFAGFLALGVVLASNGGCPQAAAQTATHSATQGAAQGAALARQVQSVAGAAVQDGASPSLVPGFGGTDFPQGALVDDADALASQGASAARTSSAYRTIIDPRRPTFDPVTIDLTRATSIEAAPDNYLGPGEGISGTKGKCQPLPMGEGPGISYLESCNDGLRPVQTSASCDVPIVTTSAPGSSTTIRAGTGRTMPAQSSIPMLRTVVAG